MGILRLKWLVLGCLCLMQVVLADTIILKNGGRLEGKVLGEVGDRYVIDIKVSASIREERTIPKADVRLIEKEKADLKAFKAIEGLVPTPELMSVEAYEMRIGKIEEFIAAFPGSGKAYKAREMHDYLTTELVVVKSGGVKIGEEMVSAEDYGANAYEFDEAVDSNQIKRTVERRNFLEALRLFAKYERSFSKAAGREKLVPLMRQVLVAYGADVEGSLTSLESRLAKRVSGLASMSSEDRAASQRALAEEEVRGNEKFQQEKTGGEAWVTTDEFHKESLEEAKREVETELTRLKGKMEEAQPAVPVAELYRVAWGKLSGGADSEKLKVIDEAKAGGVPEEYVIKLQDRAGIVTPK